MENELKDRIIQARSDIEKSFNTETPYGKVYSAGDFGKGFSGLVFNRDVSYAGILALNQLYPSEMLESLKTVRAVRKRLGFACHRACGGLLEGVEGVICEELSPAEFFKKYQKASAINKTDDVCWLWCAYDLLSRGEFSMDEWKWLYENGLECFERFYAPFYDPADGLYFGQPSFLDVGHNGYPDGWNTPTQENRNRCVWVKAASTNCLYYKGLCVMAEAAKKLGMKEAHIWEERAEHLKWAILDKFVREDGGFAYFIHRDGHKEPRRDALGAAFAVLCDVTDSEKVLLGYPVTDQGVPLLHPFYDRDDYYHNNSSWGFVDAFFLLAKEKLSGISTAQRTLELLNDYYMDGHFYEWRDLRDGKVKGSPAQLWTTAAFLGAAIRIPEKRK